jgi:bifunctional DNA-binding transcriptional regulator/antitoxin component of YhaV-PrlF toxin-antitoxin module
MAKTVKAREHYGADSLDLTIPTSVVEEHDLSPGDIFEITVEEEGEDIAISYKLVHRSG